MRNIRYIFIYGIASLLTLLFAACSDEYQPTYTVGEADNAIQLRAGISGENPAVRASRATETTEAHAKHRLFAEGSKLALRIDGYWKKLDTESTSKDNVLKSTTGTAGTVDNDTHRALTLSPKVYWDDYGTADPDNTEGRGRGLTIYGAAVSGYNGTTGTSGLPQVADGNTLEGISNWTAVSWTLPSNQTANNAITNHDLLTSNNIKDGGDGTLKFEAWKKKDGSASDLLVFTHAMTKMTVNLTPGEGFAGNFQQTPTVTLLNFYYKGTVDVEKKTSTASTADKGDIQLQPGTVGALGMTPFSGLVFPGNQFADAANIAKIEADGNIYNVTAAKLNAAITSGDKTLLQGTNYVLNVTVNKTGVDVTATIRDWDEVTAAEETPIINFGKCYGQVVTETNGLENFTKDFTLYRSTNKTEGPYNGGEDKAQMSYADSKYTMTPQLYWPDHQTHYFFRGVWPQVGETGGPAAADVKATGIAVKNCDYSANTYPSCLMLGMPRKADGTPDETCKNGHNTEGICATDAPDGSSHADEGLLHMNFQYAMAQVIVKLTTSTDASGNPLANGISINEHTKVKIINGYTEGMIKFADGTSDFTGKATADFEMTNDNGIDGALTNQYANYRNAVVPQSLTNAADGDLKFRITIGDGTNTDVYETVLGIKNIKVDGKTITAWEPGKRYIYTLNITKTGIQVTATLKDWTDVTGSEDIWM